MCREVRDVQVIRFQFARHILDAPELVTYYKGRICMREGFSKSALLFVWPLQAGLRSVNPRLQGQKHPCRSKHLVPFRKQSLALHEQTNTDRKNAKQASISAPNIMKFKTHDKIQ